MPLLDLILISGQFVNVQQMVVAGDAAGGQVNTWQTLTVNGVQNVPVIIRAPSTTTVMAFEQRGIKVNCQVLFAFNLDAAIPTGLTAAYRFQEVGTGFIHAIEGGGLLNSLIVSAEVVYRCDTYRRQAST